MKAKKVYEFVNPRERGLSKRDVGLGINVYKNRIKKWFDKHFPDVKYTINDDFTTIVDQNFLEFKFDKNSDESIPEGINFKSAEVDVRKSNIKIIEDNVDIGYFLNAINSDLEILGENFQAEIIDITNSNVDKVPESIKIEKIYISSFDEVEIPNRLIEKSVTKTPRDFIQYKVLKKADEVKSGLTYFDIIETSWDVNHHNKFDKKKNRGYGSGIFNKGYVNSRGWALKYFDKIGNRYVLNLAGKERLKKLKNKFAEYESKKSI